MGRFLARLAAVALALGMAGCGDGGDAGAPPPPAATLGPAGGTVQGPDGMAVTIAAQALDTELTIALAADSTGAPPLPAGVRALGPIYAATPHGIAFARPVRLRVPFDPAAFASPGAQPTLLTAAPGGEWTVLAGAQRDGDSLFVEVSTFSYYTVIDCTVGPCQNLTLEASLRLALDEEDPARVGPHIERAEATFRTPRYVPVQLSFSSPGDVTWLFAYKLFITHRDGRREVAAGPMGASPMRIEFPLFEADNGYRTLELEIACARPAVPYCANTAPGGGGANIKAFSVRLSGPRIAVDIPAGTPVDSLLPMVTEQPQDVRADAGAHPVPFSVSVAQSQVTHYWEASTDGGITWTDLGPYPVNFNIYTVLGQTVVNRLMPGPVLTSTMDYAIDYCCSLGAARPIDRSANGTQIRARLVNAFGQRYSRVATLTVAPSSEPVITQQPQSAAVAEGQGASFTVVASGSPAPGYRWQQRGPGASGWTDVAGQNRATYATGPLALSATGTQVRVVVTNPAGSATSEAATISVTSAPVPPAILGQPQPLTVSTGATALFAASVSGTGPLSFQWLRDGVAVPGANAAVLQLDAVALAASGSSYRLRVSNTVGSVDSSAALLTVVPDDGGATPTPPAITLQPAPVTVNTGNTATLAVGASGSAPLSYQWRRNGTAIAGATAAAYTIASAAAGDAGSYSVVVANAAGSATSSAAALTVIAAATPVAPTITGAPASVVVLPGATTTLAVAATGSAPLAYAWRRNGIVVDGATGPLLTLSGITSLQAGSYTVTVSNGVGAATSAPAQVLLVGAPQITVQPLDTGVVAGQKAAFGVSAAGDALRYQWTRNAVAIDGATAASYVTPALTPADNGAAFAVIVYNGAGLVFSSSALLTVTAAPPPSVDDAAWKLATGANHSCAVRSDHRAACWGSNSNGQLGNGSFGSAPVTAPVVWDLPEPVRRVAAGTSGSCALTATTGTVYCTGFAINAYAPTELAGFSGVKDIAMGALHACLVAADGTVWCWGQNTQYELGNGTTTGSFTPVQVLADVGAPLESAVAIDATNRHTCALLGGGTVRCWGANSSHQLGYDPFSSYAGDPGYARAVPSLSGVAQVAAGASHSCARMTDATVKCWGDNSLGQIGQERLNPVSQPVTAPTTVLQLAGAAQIAAGIRHNCARLSGGGLSCWGTTYLGNGGGSETFTLPTAVSGLAGVLAVDGGDAHTCALRSGASLHCWGANASGQLGTGDTDTRSTPAAAVPGTTWWQP